MKWKTKKIPSDGDYRKIERFLFFPKNINGEARWLCNAEFTQRYKAAENIHDSEGWVDFRWED